MENCEIIEETCPKDLRVTPRILGFTEAYTMTLQDLKLVT